VQILKKKDGGRGPCLKKNVLPLACYNFDTREQIWIFFGRNVTDKVRDQKMLYYATSNNLCFCTTHWNEETWKLHFHSNAVLVHCRIQLVAVWFLQYFWLTTHAHAAVWLPRSCNQCVHFRAVGGHGSEERKSRALQQLDCVAPTMHQCAVFWVSSSAR